MRRFLAALGSLFVLYGCTTSEQADKLLAKGYQGRKADEFFTKYGPPSSSYKLQAGGVLYTWEERARYWQSSGTASTQVFGSMAVTTVSPGQTHLQQCQLKLTADPSGTITMISVLNDSLGVWQMSRCNELFSSR